MKKIEHRKVSQIIGELTTFLLNHGKKEFQISYMDNDDKETIIIKTSMLDIESLMIFKDKMGRTRETEIETYGWSLMGDTELEITGLLIDEVLYEEVGNQLIITIKRNKNI